MKNLAAQLAISGHNPDNTLNKKSIKLFDKFSKAMEGKTFVGKNDKNETVRFKIGYISFTASIGCVNLARTPDALTITIHRTKINWFDKNGRTGAWLEDCGAII